MTAQGADKAITTSALIVAGIYTYRRLTEGSGTASSSKAAQLLGRGSPPSIGVFITAWGTAYLIMAIMAQASPGLGGAFAITTAVADVLSNGQQLSKDINGKLGTTTKSSSVGAPTSPVAVPPTTTVLKWTPSTSLQALP
jgi:hypothetical protein